jgi:putative DNA primase/helicase
MTEALAIQCGPASSDGRRLVIATLGKREHRDRLDTDDAFKRQKFRQECIRRLGLDDAAEVHEDIETKLIRAADAEDAHADGGSMIRPALVRLADVEPEPVEWLWPGRIAIGKVTMLAGDPGLGKSFVTLDIAARVTRGAPWPDTPHVPQPVGGVVLLSGEDDVADTIRPRLDANGADVSKVIALQGICGADTTGDYKRPVDLARDLEQLRAAIMAVTNCRLLIVDPVSAYMGKSDSHVNAEVRGILAPLAELAAELRVAILCVSHLRKGEGQALHRTMGSLAFVAAARTAWVVCRDQSDPSRRLLLSVKNNLAADVGDGLAYTIECRGLNDAPAVCWAAEPVTITADEAMAPESRRRGPAANERDEAAEWLRASLANSSKLASEIIDDADQCGFSKRTIQRAFQALGGRREKQGFSGGWHWSLPEDAMTAAAELQQEQLGTLGETWHLRPNPEENGVAQPRQNNVDTEDAKLVCTGMQPGVTQEHNAKRGLCSGRLTPNEVNELHQREQVDGRS